MVTVSRSVLPPTPIVGSPPGWKVTMVEPFLPREVLIDRHLRPGAQRWTDGSWVYPDERITTEKHFYRLIRDHTDQPFADFIFTTVRTTLDAYYTATPATSKPSFCIDEEHQHPRMVRTDAECEACSEDELRADIVANAEQVAALIVPQGVVAPAPCSERLLTSQGRR